VFRRSHRTARARSIYRPDLKNPRRDTARRSYHQISTKSPELRNILSQSFHPSVHVDRVRARYPGFMDTREEPQTLRGGWREVKGALEPIDTQRLGVVVRAWSRIVETQCVTCGWCDASKEVVLTCEVIEQWRLTICEGGERNSHRRYRGDDSYYYRYRGGESAHGFVYRSLAEALAGVCGLSLIELLSSTAELVLPTDPC